MNRTTQAALAALAALAAGCQTYEGPPVPKLAGLQDGILSDPDAPLVVSFSKRVDPATLRVKVATYQVDAEGNLGDEDQDPATQLDVLFRHDPAGDESGTAQLTADRRWLTITPDKPLPVGPALVLLVEPGLADEDGHAQRPRLRIRFSYRFECGATGGAVTLPSGAYFLLVDVQKPVPTQIQLWGSLIVSASTGKLVGQFTNADRNGDPARCQPPCKPTEACRLVPTMACVIPSEKAGTTDEYADFVPNAQPPTGYTFTVNGCAEERAGATLVATWPADVQTQAPAVTVRGIRMSAEFRADAAGVVRGSGAYTADDVLLGTTSSGPAAGTLAARRVPDEETPAGLPAPPYAP